MNEAGMLEEWKDGFTLFQYSTIPLFHVDETN